MVQYMVAPTNHVFVTPTNLSTWAGFTLRGAPRTYGILQHLLAEYYGKDKKMCHVVNQLLVITLRS